MPLTVELPSWQPVLKPDSPLFHCPQCDQVDKGWNHSLILVQILNLTYCRVILCIEAHVCKDFEIRFSTVKNKIAHILSERDPLPVGNWFIIPSWLPGALYCKNEWMEGTDGWVIPSSIRLTTTTLDTSRVLQKYIFLRRQKPNLSHVQSC